jgi:hypothetical protein
MHGRPLREGRTTSERRSSTSVSNTTSRRASSDVCTTCRQMHTIPSSIELGLQASSRWPEEDKDVQQMGGKEWTCWLARCGQAAGKRSAAVSGLRRERRDWTASRVFRRASNVACRPLSHLCVVNYMVHLFRTPQEPSRRPGARCGISRADRCRASARPHFRHHASRRSSRC